MNNNYTLPEKAKNLQITIHTNKKRRLCIINNTFVSILITTRIVVLPNNHYLLDQKVKLVIGLNEMRKKNRSKQTNNVYKRYSLGKSAKKMQKSPKDSILN